MKAWMMVVMVVMVGCVAVEDPLAEVASGEPGGVIQFLPPGGEMQGRKLLGSYADGIPGLGHFRVSATAANRPVTLEVSGARLIARDANGAIAYADTDPQFVGLVMTGVPSGELQITGVALRDGLPVYELQHRSHGGPWVDYCAGAGGAIALQGRWSLSGLHLAGTTISFGCEDAATYKCTVWGYVAGNGGEGTTGWDHHQACTRMARADYCADDTPHTYEQTPIVIRDRIVGAQPGSPELVHPASLPAPPDQFFFEAAWAPGARGPVCMSKTRWAALPVGGTCPDVLPDPRKDGSAQFCDDMTMAEMAAAGAVVFNASKTNDMMLHRWSNGVDTVSTVRGMPGRAPVAPFSGYTIYRGADGIVLRNLPGSISTSEVRELRALRDPSTGDRVISRPGLHGGYLDDGFEGWTFNSGVADPGLPPHVPFVLYRNSTSTDRTSSIALPAGFTYQASLDHVTVAE